MLFNLIIQTLKAYLKTFIRYLFLPKDISFIDDFSGVEYLYSSPRRTRILGQIATGMQWCLWKCNIHWHNPIRDECTPDFSCYRNKKF